MSPNTTPNIVPVLIFSCLLVIVYAQEQVFKQLTKKKYLAAFILQGIVLFQVMLLFLLR